MLIVTGAVTARPDSFEALLEASLAHVERSRTEPGCLSHAVMIDAENPLRLVFFEQWADRETLQTHFRQPGSALFLDAVKAFAAAPPELAVYDAAARPPPGV